MKTGLTDFERELIRSAVAAAPPLSDEQGAELKRVLKPYVQAQSNRTGASGALAREAA